MAKKKETKISENIETAMTYSEAKTKSKENKSIQTDRSTNIETMPILDLLCYEQATTIICRRYENNIKLYDGTIRHNGPEYEKFKKVNDIHNNILNEIEKRVNGLEYV